MKRLLTLVLLLLPFSMLHAQGLDIGLVSGNEASLPIAVVPMPYQGSAGAPDTDVAEVIRNDLNRSGQFRSLAVASIVEKPDPWQRDPVPHLAPAQAGLRGGRPGPRRDRRRLSGRVRTVRRGQAGAPARHGGGRPGQGHARCRAPDRRPDLREDPRRARRVLDPGGLHHRQRHGPGHAVRADGRRLRRLQPADDGALARAAAVAGLEPRWHEARLCEFRARQFDHLHRRKSAPARARWWPASRASTALRRFRRTAGAWP